MQTETTILKSKVLFSDDKNIAFCSAENGMRRKNLRW